MEEGAIWKTMEEFSSIFFNVYVCLHEYMCTMCGYQPTRGETRVSQMYPQQLELQAYVNCCVDCREQNVGTSSRAVSALKLQSHLRIKISNILDSFLGRSYLRSF